MSDVANPARTSLAQPVVDFVRSWNRFWFTPADPTLLGLIRILCGTLTLYVHLAYTVDLREFFGPNAWIDRQKIEEFRHEWPYLKPQLDWADRPPLLPPTNEEEARYFQRYKVNPRQVAGKGYFAWSVWYHVTDPTAMVVVHGVILTAMFLFAIGFCTRVTSVLTWLGAVSYMQRGPTTVFGMDTMMNLLLLYLMVGPSGAAWSVDRLIARYWTTWRALRDRRPVPARLAPAPRVSANVALRLIQVNLCIIYLASGLCKLQGGLWWRGSAVYGTLANPEFSPLYYDWFYNGLVWLCKHRPAWEVAMTSGTAFTLLMEIGFPFLIWYRPLRWVFLAMAAMLHTGIAFFMGLNTFSLMMLIMLLSFVPAEAIQRAIALLAAGAAHFRLEVNRRVRGQVRAASALRAVDAFDQLELVDETPVSAGRPSAGAPERPAAAGLRLVSEDRTEFTGYPLFERLMRSLRPLWLPGLVTRIPGVSALGRSRYPGEVRTAALEEGESPRMRARGEKAVR